MKIKIFLFTFLFFFPLLAQAQLTVVRIKNNQIYLDTSTVKSSVQKGDTFKVILSSEKLVNPKTGKDLGLVYNYSEAGKIVEVQPLYAVGELRTAAGISVGQEAVLEQTAPVTAATAAATAVNTSNAKTSYAPVDQQIIGITEADIIRPGAANLVTLSDKGQITVWTRQAENLVQESSYQLPKNKTPLVISAMPLRNTGTAEIFATVYDSSNWQISTLVLAYQNAQWELLDTLPYYVKELGCTTDKKLWMQRPFISSGMPGKAHPLTYQDGRFQPAEETLDTRHSWLSGVNLFPAEGETAPRLVYTSPYGKIKMDLPNGKTTQYKDLSIGTPNRVKYKQDILKFYPPIQVVMSNGVPLVAAVENTAKFGLLSATFGQYESGKIHFLSFEKGRLVLKDTVALDGVVYDTTCSDRGILTAEILPDGQSSVVEILNR